MTRAVFGSAPQEPEAVNREKCATVPVAQVPTGRSSAAIFLARVTVIHLVSYLVAGAVFSMLFDYRRLFEQPVIRDYMLPFGSTSLLLGLGLQVVRGAVLGAVLLPFRKPLAASRWGWLHLWLLMVGIGIVSTPAAAPSSLEAVIYTRLPLWYHAIGLPEILSQTLVFSWLVHAYLRHPGGLVNVLPRPLTVVIRAAAAACVAFFGYAVVSVTFALVSGVAVRSSQNMGLRTQGMFLLLFLANLLLLAWYLHTESGRVAPRRRLILGLAIYASNVLLIVGYQAVLLGGAGILYPVLAPVLPALLALLAVSPSSAHLRQRGP